MIRQLFERVRGELGYRRFSISWYELAALIVPFSIYLATTSALSGWIIDDAGITYAYARNFAAGHGLVSQPGFPPVEGYSNFLWLVLLSPFFVLHLFHPYLTVKIISFALVAVSFWLLHRSITRYLGGNFVVSALVLTCLALNASFVIWTCSGLENPLLVALAVLLFYLCLRYLSVDAITTRTPFIIGLVALGVALTRPDGILYASVFPLVLVLQRFYKPACSTRAQLVDLGKYAVVMLGGYGSFLLFRLAYFGLLHPHTYYAKGGPSISSVIKAVTLQGNYLAKFSQLSASVVGSKASILLPIVFVIIISWQLLRREHRPQYFLLVFLAFLTGLIHMIMPNDWMGEFRFATPMFAFVYLLLVVFTYAGVKRVSSSSRTRIIIGTVLSLILIAATVQVHVPRLQKFYGAPKVAFEGVRHRYSDRFEGYAEKLGLTGTSVLLPDVGAVLYYSKQKIYDLARLTDRVVARTLGRDQPAFYDYVFETIKPTFIHIHGNWTLRAEFDEDERFRRDYVPIHEYLDKWVKKTKKRDMMSGNYVRKDAIEGREQLFEQIRVK